MNVQTIQMDPKVAAGKLSALARMLKRQPGNDEWRAAQTGYRILAKGTPLIDPFKAIRESGWDTGGLPKIAMARADRKRVTCFTRWDGVRFDASNWPKEGDYRGWGASFHKRADLHLCIDVRDMRRPDGGARSGHAIVPNIPADVYPERGHGTPKDWFILWEADWTAAPADPMLLKPIGGNLYAVLAQWDLTELERAILGGSRA